MLTVPPGEDHVDLAITNLCILAVPQPDTNGQVRLPGARREIAHFQGAVDTLSSSPTTVTLFQSASTVDGVLAQIPRAYWVHFASHGIQDGEGKRMPDARGATRALHVAVARLRARNVPSTSWVPFIRVGLRIRVVGFCDVSDVLRLVVRRTLCSAGPGMVHAVGYHHVFIIISWRTSHIVDRISGYCTPNSSIEG